MKRMKKIVIILLILFFCSGLMILYAEEGEIEPSLDYVESDSPPSAPTNRSYIVHLLDKYKTSLETKDIDKFLSCFSKAFSKEMVEVTSEYTNRFYLTYADIEEGVRQDNFSAYQGKTVKVSYNIKSISISYTEADIKLELKIIINGAVETRQENFRLEWNREESCWQIMSY